MSEFISHFENEAQKLVEADVVCEFNEWGLKGEWLKLADSDGDSVEGANYKPESANGEVVIFHPGLPGEGVSAFEEKFVQELLSQGYEVFAARHNGLKDQSGNDQLFHNKRRAKKGPISGNPFSWFSEPKVSIGYFAQQDKPISLVTHSFSGITAANSFIDLAEKSIDNNPAANVKKWILASGSVWEISNDGTLDPDRDFTLDQLKQYCEYFGKLYNIPGEDGVNQLLEHIKGVLQRINAKIGESVPDNIETIGIYPEADKLVSPNIGINLIGKLPRGIVLKDYHLPYGDEDPHEFEQATANDLLRILKMKTSTNKHIFNINK